MRICENWLWSHLVVKPTPLLNYMKFILEVITVNCICACGRALPFMSISSSLIVNFYLDACPCWCGPGYEINHSVVKLVPALRIWFFSAFESPLWCYSYKTYDLDTHTVCVCIQLFFYFKLLYYYHSMVTLVRKLLSTEIPKAEIVQNTA